MPIELVFGIGYTRFDPSFCCFEHFFRPPLLVCGQARRPDLTELFECGNRLSAVIQQDLSQSQATPVGIVTEPLLLFFQNDLGLHDHLFIVQPAGQSTQSGLC